jgi:hypothetical protein
MPLFEEDTNPKNNHQSTDQLSQTSPEIPQKEFNLVKTIGQLLPLAPFVFEQFTGQKIPAMTGTMAEIQLALNQIHTNLQTVTNNQQQLAQRLIALETNANNHLTNLTQQFNSLRLTHTKERKQIEYNPPQLEEKQRIHSELSQNEDY